MLVLLLIVPDSFGLIGDHPFFIVHMITNKIYFLKNGFFSPPFYVPSFNGGYPEYADPQNLYYSLLQMCVNIFSNVYTAIKVGFVVQLALCYAGTYFLFREFKIDKAIAALGGVLFSINGYNVARWTVGHLSFQSYWAVPFILGNLAILLVSRETRQTFRSAIWISLLLSLLFYSSDVFSLYIATVLSFFFVVSWFLVYRQIEIKKITAALAVVAATTLFMSISRIHAIFSLLHWFPRKMEFDVITVPKLLWLIPHALFDTKPSYCTPLPHDLGGWHEYTSYVGVFLGLCLIVGIGWLIYDRRNSVSAETKRTGVFFVCWAAIGILGASYLMMGKNMFWDALKNLPGVSSNHGIYRVIGGMPLVCIAAFIALLNTWFSRFKSKTALIVIGAFCLIDLCAHHLKADISCYRKFDLPYEQPLKSVAITAWTPIDNYGGVLAPNPIFGWDGKFLHPKVDMNLPPDHVFPDGTYNVNDPVAMIFPRDVGREPWSRLPATVPLEQLKKFLEFKDPHFAIPLRQKAANAVSLLSWCSVLLYLSLEIWRKFGNRNRRTPERREIISL